MNKLIRQLLATSLLLTSLVALAESDDLLAPPKNDQELNAIYKKIMLLKNTTARTLSDIKKSQSLWLKSRAASCDLTTEPKGYVDEALKKCLSDENKRRIEFLNLIYESIQF